MSIQAFPIQWQANNPLVTPSTGVLTQFGQYLLLALYNRTGAGSGLPDSVGNNLRAVGLTQADALALINDYNEITSDEGGNNGVILLSLKPSQAQIVFNGSADPINVYPPVGGNIDGLGLNVAYPLNQNKTQIFTCWGLQTSGVPYYRSLQLG